MAKLPGEGTLLQLGDGAATEVFTTVAQRTSIEGPDRKVEAVETSDLDSEAEEFRPSQIPDSGEVSMSCWFDPADALHTEIEAMLDPPTDPPPDPDDRVRNWRLVFNNKTNARPHREFTAFPTAFKYTGMEKNGNLGYDLSLRITGKITKGTTTLV